MHASPGAARIPDLLHPVPRQRIVVEMTKVAMTFAFASGVSGGLFAEALDKSTVAPSTWEPAAYVSDLFLHEFVARCFQVRLGGRETPLFTSQLVKLLERPPADPAVAEHRRAVAAELAASPELRAELEQLYAALCKFRSLLEGATAGRKWDANRRQLDILLVAKEIFDRMAERFGAARSGLAVLSAFGQEVRQSEPYRSLSDLLRYEEHLATVSLKVRVGADGRIQAFELQAVQENAQNPFVSSPMKRWLARIELFLRGYKFGEGEIMARLIDAVFEGLEDDLVQFVQLLVDIEFYLGALGFRDMARAAGLAVCLPEFVSPTETRELSALFNPLLLVHGGKAVPCNLASDRHATTVLVTGPNSGGKTRLLQAIGIAQILGQSGLFVPARVARLALAPGLVVSLIQETKADQTEGRLGVELIRIRALFERLPPGAMVILDELCSGTNPSEGEEIFELVVKMLTRLKPQAFITTHFLAFAARLEKERKIADLRFLHVELGQGERPTYQFAPGVARTSLAGQAAARLGVTGDQLLSLVERNIAQMQGAMLNGRG
jgi:DNA mismatch repair protein MutS2